MSFDELLKQATAYKKSGNIKEALESLKKARAMREDPHIAYTPSHDIKYANYLQAAQRSDDGWRVLNEAKIYFSSFTHDQYEIQNAMRLFLQREGRNDLAVIHGAISLIYQAKHFLWLYQELENEQHPALNKTQNRLKTITARPYLSTEALKLLKRANKTELLNDLTDSVQGAILALPAFDELCTYKKMAVLLGLERK